MPMPYRQHRGLCRSAVRGISAYFVCFLFLLVSSSAQAAPVNANKARLAARSLHRDIREVVRVSDGNDLVGHLVRLAPSGYVLLSTDDQAPPVKLYSEGGSFDDLPAEFRAVILTEMREDLAVLADARVRHGKNAAKYASQWDGMLAAAQAQATDTLLATAGTTLVTTSWDQGDPYNLYCPSVTGGSGGRAWAGCVATALAQILRYHRQPLAIIGSHSYTDLSGSCTGTHAFTDVGTGAYDWANMPLSISTSSTTAQKQAVGQLIYHCAVAVDMDFESSGSSSSAQDAPAALVDHFGYNAGAAYQPRSGYASAVWYNMLASDINVNRPVLYSIWTAGYAVGHAVVCDGYRNGNQIHLNFGWSGTDTAWYNMDSVSAQGYSWTIHAAVFGIACPNYTLELTSVGAGTGSVKVNGTLRSLPWSGNLAAGSSVTLQGVPDSGYVLGAWTGDLSGNSNPTSILLNGYKSVGVNFTPPYGSLRVTLAPRGLVAAGGAWRRTGTSTWYASGQTDPVVPVGTYTVEFRTTTGWTSPASLTGIAVSEGALTTASATYAMSPQLFIGAGTGDTWQYPLNTNRDDFRSQSIYLAGDIGCPRTIVGLAVDVTSAPPIPMNNFTIRMKPTTLANYNLAQNFEATGWTTVYQANQTVSATGWAQFNFTMPFNFNFADGNNVMVDISFNNSTWNNPGYCRYTSSVNTRTVYNMVNSTLGDPLLWSGHASFYDTAYPNLRLTVVPHADANRDMTVNFKDFALIMARWNQSGCSAANQWCAWADVDRSGAVNARDMLELASHWLD